MIEILNVRATDNPKVFIVNGLHDIGETDENYPNVIQWVSDGKEVMPPLSDSDIKAINEQNSKAQKQLLLDSITVTTASGKVFDGREKDVPLMNGALKTSEVLVEIEEARYSAITNPTADDIALHEANMLKATSADWKLHDNTVQVVTIAELKEALALAMVEIGKIKVGG